jgi:hypothetical protein
MEKSAHIGLPTSRAAPIDWESYRMNPAFKMHTI